MLFGQSMALVFMQCIMVWYSHLPQTPYSPPAGYLAFSNLPAQHPAHHHSLLLGPLVLSLVCKCWLPAFQGVSAHQHSSSSVNVTLCLSNKLHPCSLTIPLCLPPVDSQTIYHIERTPPALTFCPSTFFERTLHDMTLAFSIIRCC